MSCPIYKDNDRTPHDIKCARRVASQYSGIVNRQVEEETSIYVQFTNFTDGHCQYGSPCTPSHDSRCTHWDIYGQPIRPIVIMPRPARMSNSVIVNVPNNKRSEFEKCLADLSLIGRVNTFPRQRDDTNFLLHTPDTNMFILFIRLASKWISPLDVLFPYKNWHAIKFLCIVTQKKGKNHVIGRTFEAKSTKVFINPNLCPSVVMNEIDKIHLEWNKQEQIINNRIAANPHAKDDQKQNFAEWIRPDPDQFKPEILFPQEIHADWINDYYSKDVEVSECKRKAELDKFLPGASKGNAKEVEMAYEVHKMANQLRHIQSGGGIANVVDGEYEHGNHEMSATSGNSSHEHRNSQLNAHDAPEPPINIANVNNSAQSGQNISGDDYFENNTPSWVYNMPTVSIPSVWMDEENESGRAIRLLNVRDADSLCHEAISRSLRRSNPSNDNLRSRASITVANESLSTIHSTRDMTFEYTAREPATCGPRETSSTISSKSKLSSKTKNGKNKSRFDFDRPPLGDVSVNYSQIDAMSPNDIVTSSQISSDAPPPNSGMLDQHQTLNLANKILNEKTAYQSFIEENKSKIDNLDKYIESVQSIGLEKSLEFDRIIELARKDLSMIHTDRNFQQRTTASLNSRKRSLRCSHVSPTKPKPKRRNSVSVLDQSMVTRSQNRSVNLNMTLTKISDTKVVKTRDNQLRTSTKRQRCRKTKRKKAKSKRQKAADSILRRFHHESHVSSQKSIRAEIVSLWCNNCIFSCHTKKVNGMYEIQIGCRCYSANFKSHRSVVIDIDLVVNILLKIKFKIPKPFHFLDNGKCSFEVDASSGRIVFKRKNKPIPITEARLSKWAIKKFAKWLDCNPFFDILRYRFAMNKLECDVKVLNSMITEELDTRYPWPNEYDPDESAMIDCVDNQLIESFYKNINVNTLPPTPAEKKAKKFANKQIIDTIKNINKMKSIWSSKFNFTEALTTPTIDISVTNSPTKTKPNFDNDDKIELPRQGSNQPSTNEPIYHFWTDNRPYKLIRNPKPLEYFEIEKSNSDEEYFRPDIVYINIPRSKVRGKKTVFIEVCDNLKPDICVITEAFWHQEKSNTAIPLNYDLFTHDKLKEKNTLILVKKSLGLKIDQIKSKMNETQISIKSGNAYLNLLVIYRSPTKDSKVYDALKYSSDNDLPFMKHLRWINKRVSKFLSETANAIVLGDFNADITRKCPNAADKFAKENWTDLFNECNQNIFGDEPTFYSKKKNTPSKIDYAISNMRLKVDMEVLPWQFTNDWSDHIVFKIKPRVNFIAFKQATEIETKKKLKPLEGQKNERTIERIETGIASRWADNLSADIMFKIIEEETLKELPLNIVKIPTKSYRNRDSIKVKELVAARSKWIHDRGYKGIGSAFNSKDLVLKRYNYDINKAKKDNERENLIKSIHRRGAKSSQWDFFKAYKKVDKPLPSFVCNANATANAFGKLSWNYQPLYKSLETVEESNLKFNFRVLSDEINPATNEINYFQDIKKLILDGRGSKHAYAQDGLTLMSTRLFSQTGWSFLRDAVNDILNKGRYPEEARKNKIVTVAKKPVITTHKDVRPVTVARQMIMKTEKVKAKQLTYAAEGGDIFNDQNLDEDNEDEFQDPWLHQDQYGFRPGRSIGQLQNALKKEIAKLPKGQPHCILLTDLSNAFGSTDVEVILNELKCQLNPKSHDTIKAFLSQCHSQVYVNGNKSKWFHMAPRGYSQGSCLSPLMFCLIMRHMHSRVKFKGVSFADDATFLITGKTVTEMKQNLIDCVRQFNEFCKSLGIKLNVGKTLYIYDTDLDITIDGIKIKHEKFSRILGLNLDKNCSHRPHLSYLNSQFNLTHTMICGYDSQCDERMLRALVNSYAYGKSNHGGAYLDINPVNEYQKLQSKVNRMVKYKIVKNLILDFYRKVNIINDDMNVETIYEARGKKLYDLDIQDLLKLSEYLNQNCDTDDLDRDIQARIQGNIFHLLKRMDKIEDDFDAFDQNVMKNALLERDRIRVSYPHYNNVNLPQWLLLKRARILSVQNNLRKNQMFRLGQVIKKARPVFEFNQVIEFATRRFYEDDRNRLSANYPYFRFYLPSEKKHRHAILNKSTPYIWFKELQRLPMALRSMTKNEKFINTMKKFYHKRCQHAENEKKICLKCRKPKDNYRLTENQQLINDIADFEVVEPSIIQQIDTNLSQSEILELRFSNEDNLIYELSNRDFFHVNRAIERFMTTNRD